MKAQETLRLTLEWAQDPTRECAGQPVILQTSFKDLSEAVQGFQGVKLTPAEAEEMFNIESRRFSACGANPGHDNRFAVLRKNPETGWEYIEKKLKKEEQ